MTDSQSVSQSLSVNQLIIQSVDWVVSQSVDYPIDCLGLAE